MDVLTFAQPRRLDWREAEHDAGHFLFGLVRRELPGVFVSEPSGDASTAEAEVSYGRVTKTSVSRPTGPSNPFSHPPFAALQVCRLINARISKEGRDDAGLPVLTPTQLDERARVVIEEGATVRAA